MNGTGPQQASPPPGYRAAGNPIGGAPRPQGQAAASRPAKSGAATPTHIGVGVFVGLLGVVSLIAAIVLNMAKVTMDGASLTASQANGVCQSTLGQLGQSLSSGFGNNTPTTMCNKAASIEDWKGITVWLAILLIGGGLALIAKGSVRLPASTVSQRASVSPAEAAQRSAAAKLAAAQRAEAQAARLRAQAAQMTGAQAAWAQAAPAQAAPAQPAPAQPAPAQPAPAPAQAAPAAPAASGPATVQMNGTQVQPNTPGAAI